MDNAVEYLGDGVYVEYDPDLPGYKLMTGSHTAPDNVVYLDTRVLASFNRFVANVNEVLKLREVNNVVD